MSNGNRPQYRSKLVVCRITHSRMRPKRHQLEYTIPYFVIDLSELDALHSGLRLFSCRAVNLFSFYEQDHGHGFKQDGETVSQWISRELVTIGVTDAIARTELICLPRILGYVFNPISVFFAYDSTDKVVGIVYEVNNTFGEKQIYPFSVKDEQRERLTHTCRKTLYVSPFNDVAGGYNFAVTPPGANFKLDISYRDENGLILHAAMAGETIPISKRALASVAVRFPLAAFTVVAAIHWEALKLWLKGVPFRSRRQPKAV